MGDYDPLTTTVHLASILDSCGATVVEIGQRHVTCANSISDETPMQAAVLFSFMAECIENGIDYGALEAVPVPGNRWQVRFR